MGYTLDMVRDRVYFGKGKEWGYTLRRRGGSLLRGGKAGMRV